MALGLVGGRKKVFAPQTGVTPVLSVASGCCGEAEGQWADFCHENAAQVGDAEEG